MDEERKTPESLRKAIKNYDEKFDKIYIRFEKGTADRIKKLGFSVNNYVKIAVADRLEHDEKILGKNLIKGSEG